MKYIKSLIIVFCLFTLIFAGVVFYFVKTFDVNKYKSKIEFHLSDALKRPVTIDEIELNISLSKGLSFELKDLIIDDLLEVESTYFLFDIDKYMNGRDIVVDEVILKSPHIQITQTEKKKKKAKLYDDEVDISDLDDDGGGEQGSDSLKGRNKLVDFTIQKIEIIDGSLQYLDYSGETQKKVNVDHLNIEVIDFSFNKSFQYNVAGSMLSDKDKVFELDGKATYYSLNNKIRLHDNQFNIYLGELSIDQLLQEVPSLASSGLEYISDGQLTLNVEQLLVEEGQIAEITGDGLLSETSIRLNHIQTAIEINSEFDFDQKDIKLNELNINLADGTIAAIGEVKDYLSTVQFKFESDLNGVDITQLINQDDLPFTVSGLLQGNMDLSGQGFDEIALKNYLNGKGQITFEDGKLIDFNLLEFVIEKLSTFPRFAEKLQAELSEFYREKLEQEDTIINEGEVVVKIAAGRLVLNRIQLDADGFVYSAKGDLDFNHNLDLTSSFYLAEDLSQSMIRAQEELSALLDEYQQLKIPFKRYQGKIEDFKPVPDINHLIKQGIQNRGKQELKKALYKALDIDAQAPPEANGDQQAEQNLNEAPQREVTPEEILIENVLEVLPIFQ